MAMITLLSNIIRRISAPTKLYTKGRFLVSTRLVWAMLGAEVGIGRASAIVAASGLVTVAAWPSLF